MDLIKVFMSPSPQQIAGQTASGIQTTILQYEAHAKFYQIEFVGSPDDADLVAVHAGTFAPGTERLPFVAHCHGLYWTADYKAEPWEYRANREVTEAIRRADVVTVPSQWVAQTLRRDMHLDPVVLPHGIVAKDWRPNPSDTRYTLWNKNRSSDACDPTPIQLMSERFPDDYFMTTFAKDSRRARPNLKITGAMPHDKMKSLVEGAYIYLATTKETFGIGTLEAMAAGVPILGFDYGGTSDIVRHGIDGYLAEPGNYEDLFEGYKYCLTYRDALSENAIKHAQNYKWSAVMRQLRSAYELAIERFNEPHNVSVIVPCFNKQETIARSVRSAAQQTVKPDNIVVVDNNSSDDSNAVASSLRDEIEALGISYIVTNCPAQGVAHARNWGCGLVDTRYLCCLDGDDEIAPEFLEKCVDALRSDRAAGVAYTKLVYIAPDKELQPEWPDKYDFDRFLNRQNQVPTCAVFRRDIWSRLGGYRQRYAPNGAGAEDAEFWLRIGMNGYSGILASNERLFRYHSGGQVSSDRTYVEEDWLAYHPSAKDKVHPFASLATPRNHPTHPVRQYDTPKVSVIIPCSHSHLRYLIDAIDSLESQYLRQWEAIVVFDFAPMDNEVESLLSMYPYLTILTGEEKPAGSGAARNRGVKAAKSNLILFLDADDWLEPNCLLSMVNTHESTGHIVYSDYYGHAHLERADAEAAQRANRLKAYYSKRGEAITIHDSMDYDCERAQQQPSDKDGGRFYIWNLVTSLTTKDAHNAIGGFDEKMVSYEDWDYWLRMAQNGYCFTRITAPLVNYRFYSGGRRETGRQNHDTLIDYLRAKYQGDTKMAGCRGCRGGRSKAANPQAVPSPQGSPLQSFSRQVTRQTMSAEEMIMVELTDGNSGEHPIVMRDPATNKSINYGYRKHGDKFLMRQSHAALYPQKFRVVESDKKPDSESKPQTKRETPPPPNVNAKISNPVDAPKKGGPDNHPEVNWNSDLGMTELQSSKLDEAGIRTFAQLEELGVEGLRDITGMSENMAEKYLAEANARSGI